MWLFSASLLLQHFADAPAACSSLFFGLPAWYKYLPSGDFAGKSCQIDNFNFPGDFTYVAVAAVDIALAIAGMAAVFFVIYGGIQYVISQGEPDKTRGAKNTITNALVGLVIAGIAISVVSFLGSQLGSN
jgi:hypothetical protein